MSRAASPPAAFPDDLLIELAGRGRMLLMLDYDGTLAPIVSDPAAAHPLPGAREALAALAVCRDRIEVAVISGRSLDELARLLGIERGLHLVGVHGLESADPDGRRAVAAGLEPALAELAMVRRWLRERAGGIAGLVIEDKRLAVALHYRNADPGRARPIVEEFERYLASEAEHLALKRGKMVVEAAPRGADKGAAVRRLMKEAGADATPVYFGDDLTDEDAFRTLAERGVTVIVGGSGASAAAYRVAGPARVAALLQGLAAALGRG